MLPTQLIRTVTLLCLIATTAIQPLTLQAARAACPSGDCAATSLDCDGCGCCQVEQANQRCGCCQALPDSGCCGVAHEETAGDSDSAENRPPAQWLSREAKVLKGAAAHPAQVHSRCLCGVRGEPAVPPSPRVPSSDQRDLPLVAMLAPGQLAGAILVPHPRTDHCGGLGSSSDHFGQRLLCSWRL